MWPFVGISGFHRGIGKKKKKATKPKPANWLATLTLGQLAELCTTCGLPKSGTKAALVSRLLDDESACEFAVEGRADRLVMSGEYGIKMCGGRDGHSVASLKELCTSQGLRAAGTRYELVLRLCRHATGPPPKALRVDADGMSIATPPRLVKDMGKLSERVAGWCSPDTSKWSNQKYKDHAGSVFRKCEDILSANTHGAPAHGIAVARAVVRGLLIGCADITGWGYGEFQAGLMGATLKKLTDAGLPTLTETREQSEDVALYEDLRRVSQFCADHLKPVIEALKGRLAELI
jgi:hypothetical protein